MFHRHFGLNAHGCGDHRNGFVANGDQLFALNLFPANRFFMQPIVRMAVQGDFRCEQRLFVDFRFQRPLRADTKIGFSQHNAFL
ncbi:Uncharacterised protein [Salmonella enterica subsp. enterica serovar Bovismorbificans]|nr:Uncharacterised protein [Salmonella enterica subsp. enterica serovar Bovismorbificans]